MEKVLKLYSSVSHESEDGISIIIKYPPEKYEHALKMLYRAYEVEDPRQLNPAIINFSVSNQEH